MLAERYILKLFHALLNSFTMFPEMSVPSDVPWFIMLVWNVKLLSEAQLSYMVLMSYSAATCAENHLHHRSVILMLWPDFDV
jgi:hypothetical protein